MGGCELMKDEKSCWVITHRFAFYFLAGSLRGSWSSGWPNPCLVLAVVLKDRFRKFVNWEYLKLPNGIADGLNRLGFVAISLQQCESKDFIRGFDSFREGPSRIPR
jgi:hypothetical protein